MSTKADCLTPKLPPEFRAARSRRREPGTRSARAITGCREYGPWKFEWTS